MPDPDRRHQAVPDHTFPFLKRAVLLLFSDDSTLFFALRMREFLQSSDKDLKVEMGWLVHENALSYRQMEQLLPEGPDHTLFGKNAVFELMIARRYKAIITSRVYANLSEQLRHTVMRLYNERPCVISFLGGLDFTPKNGYFHRRNCDGVFVFPRGEIEAFKTQSHSWGNRMWQEVGFGHPAVVRSAPLNPAELAIRRDIYFFTQALSPSTKRSRLHMIRAMAAIARANPNRKVWIKLRHLPDENKQHLHLEKYDYPSLMASLPDKPENLELTACTMDDALSNAALGITCTSTAALDLVRVGVPCMVHLDYVDHYRDPLVEPMRKLFQKSGLIISLDDMLHLRTAEPAPEWLEEMYCGNDLGQHVQALIQRFHQRPFQAPVEW